MSRVIEAKLSCVLLQPGEVEELWPQLEPLYQAAFDSNEITKGVFSAGDILMLAQRQRCYVFGFFADGELRLTLAIQFADTASRRVATILGMGGRNFRLFMHHYWPNILDWLRDNDVVTLYTETTERNAKIYMKKFMEPFGKPKSAVKLGLDL